MKINKYQLPSDGSDYAHHVANFLHEIIDSGLNDDIKLILDNIEAMKRRQDEQKYFSRWINGV
jgi:hypothetical protein